MPSRVPSIHFTVRIDATWHPLGDDPPEHHDAASFVRHQLREYTARMLRRYSVLDVPAAQDAVNASIDRPWSPESWLVTRGHAALTVSAAEQHLADEHLQRAQHGDLEREETRRRVTFLQSMLSDPDRRRVWWIDQYPDRLNELDQLTKVVADLKPPRDTHRHGLQAEVAWFVDQLLTDMHTQHQREIFLLALTQTLRTLGSTDLQNTAARWLADRIAEPGVDTA
ncbi:hypothetical protein ACH40E_33625 [Streptomyces acidicola]|uniref:hypothetical protein n=1 Tax=Streptomyces acidicola TaxID=2596892 RepID=UPI0037955CAD